MAAALAKDPELRPTAAGLLLGMVGAPVKAADPRAALMEAGARKAAAAPEADSPKATGAERAGGEAGALDGSVYFIATSKGFEVAMK
ncbi:hypothetical protein [Streptomyces parvus]|uniref:hypothetical protein n=1 Tax=Streptomyces parvus TaxID=66428 RepID=UPI0033D2E029